MRVIGLTGGLATGKSTVTAMFAKLGAKTLNADDIVHQLMKQGGACYKLVVRQFGKGILKGRRIDRKKLAASVFTDRKKLKRLEAIIHPEVRKEIQKKIRQWKQNKNNTVAVIDVPLLFEAHMNRLVDSTVVVRSTRDRAISRAINKTGLKRVDALKRIKAQMPLRKKVRLADFIIDNNGTLTNLKHKVKQVWEKL